MLHSAKYLMRAGARVTLKAFLPTLSRRSFSLSLSHFPATCPGHCSNQTYFSGRKPDPASCQRHQSHSIPPPLLSGMHFSHPFLFSIPLVSRQRCLGLSRGSVFGCPRSIHPSVAKQDTGTSSVSTGLHFRLVDDKCHRLRRLRGEGARLGTHRGTTPQLVFSVC